jgi:uncharacterized metal-binding protein
VHTGRSDGCWHERIAGVLLFTEGVVALIVAERLGAFHLGLAFLAGGWLGVYLVTPDVDFLTVTHAESRWFRDPKSRDPLSLLVAFVRHCLGLLALSLGFWPGALLHHRGVSHFPVLGSLVIALLMLPSLPGLTLLAWLWSRGQLSLTIAPVVAVAWVGFCLAHLAHIVADGLQ